MLPICEHHAVIFKSIKNPNLYILGVHKDKTLTIEIPDKLYDTIYDPEDICLGSRLFQTTPVNKQYTLEIEWEAIVNSLRLFIKEGDTLYLEGFEPEIKARWGPVTCTDVISIYTDLTSNNFSPNNTKILNYLLSYIDSLTLSDLFLLFVALEYYLAKKIIVLKDAGFIYNWLIQIKDPKNFQGLLLFYENQIKTCLQRSLAHSKGIP